MGYLQDCLIYVQIVKFDQSRLKLLETFQIHVQL